MVISQRQLILEHLTDPKTRSRGISQMEALGLYSVCRLASRIDELRKVYLIRTELRFARNGRRYARYFLDRKVA